MVKALLNINEVLACIMTNWIAANLVTMLFDGSRFINNVDFGKTGYTLKTSTNGVATAKLGLDFGGGNGQCRHPHRHPLRRGGLRGHQQDHLRL